MDYGGMDSKSGTLYAGVRMICMSSGTFSSSPPTTQSV